MFTVYQESNFQWVCVGEWDTLEKVYENIHIDLQYYDFKIVCPWFDMLVKCTSV